jgi:cytidylate kinase
MSHTYVLSWDMHGLEACINISDIDKENMWAALKETDDSLPNGRSNTVSSIVNMLVMRARFNSQRHYEIYAIDTDESISVQDLKEQFEDNPQRMAVLIRSRGRKLYSNRIKDTKVIIR